MLSIPGVFHATSRCVEVLAAGIPYSLHGAQRLYRSIPEIHGMASLCHEPINAPSFQNCFVLLGKAEKCQA